MGENDEAGGGVVKMSRSPSVMEERDVNDVSEDATPLLLLLGLQVSTASSANAVFMAAVSHWHNPSYTSEIIAFKTP